MNKKQERFNKNLQDLYNSRNMVDFRQFAIRYIALITSFSKENREEEYYLKIEKNQFNIYFGDCDLPVYSTKDLSTCYGYIERLPLRKLAMQAEEIRQN